MMRVGAALGAGGALALLGVVFGAKVFALYGFALFTSIPFLIGFVAGALFSAGRPERTVTEAMGIGMLALGPAGVLLLGVQFEGGICLLMALPIALPLAALGGAFGHTLMRKHNQPGTMLLCAFLSAPALTAIESVARIPAPLLEVRTAIDVDAPPEQVWKHVVSFSELPAPTEWIFRTGIAYPVRATINGSGPGAVRRCEFTTGAFVEPVEVWDEPRLLRFHVTENPAPMEEWTPYGSLDAPHLHGFLVSERGQFLLTALPGGRTRLEGTTWYRHNMRPAGYWQLWSDAIIHRIHLRVLNHVKRLAEGDRKRAGQPA